MKNLSILFLTVLALCMGSCGSDDNGSPVHTDGDIVGKWTYSKVGMGNNLIDYPDHQEGCDKDYVELTSDGVFRDFYYDSSDLPCEEFVDIGNYLKEGNTLMVTYDGEEVDTSNILLLTNTELKIQNQDGGIVLFTRQ